MNIPKKKSEHLAALSRSEVHINGLVEVKREDLNLKENLLLINT